MKKTFAFLLFFVFLFNILGYQLIFISMQYKIQLEVKLKMEKGTKEEDLSLIPADSKDLQWTRPNKEFRYKGEMYDVVKTRTIDKKKYYSCIRDDDEMKLITHFIKVKHSNKRKERLMKRLIKIRLFYQQRGKTRALTVSDVIYSKPISPLAEPYIKVPESPPETV